MAQAFGFDRRRVNGPEVSYHPVFESVPKASTSDLGPRAGSKRVGRSVKEIRPICAYITVDKGHSILTKGKTLPVYGCPVLKTGLINQANGSAYIETEKTKIACAVCVLLLPLSSK